MDEHGNSLKAPRRHGRSSRRRGRRRRDGRRATSPRQRASGTSSRLTAAQQRKDHRAFRERLQVAQTRRFFVSDDARYRDEEHRGVVANVRAERFVQNPAPARAASGVGTRARAIAKAEEARFEKRRARMFARLGKDTTDTDTYEEHTVGSGLDRVSDDDANDDANDDAANDEDDRSRCLAFFSSAAAAERAPPRAPTRDAKETGRTASSRARGGSRAVRARTRRERARYRTRAEETETETIPWRCARSPRFSAERRRRRRRRARAERARDRRGSVSATANDETPEKPSAAAGRSETVTGRASASAARPPPRDPDEGGVPMARTGAKWWEAGGRGGDDGDVSRLERDARAPTRNKPTPTASDVEKEPIGLARDFFRAAAPFAPSGTRIASTRVDASAASGAEFPGAGASDDDGATPFRRGAPARLAGRGRRLRLRVESQSGLLGVGVGRGEWRERERERRAASST